jgi:type IV pilus assembly protein PilA
MKKNNKGFSLVELIVVVLIMGILAVALTPQVMKWVNNSRIAADKSTLDAVKDAASLAFTDETVYSDYKSATLTITIGDGKTGTGHSGASAIADATGKTSFAPKFAQYAGGQITDFTFKQANYKVVLTYTNCKLASTVSSGDGATEITDD